jgi:hypothetical protein
LVGGVDEKDSGRDRTDRNHTNVLNESILDNDEEQGSVDGYHFEEADE